MLSKINKYKKFMLDLLVNTFSFAIYIVSQQLIFMPLMGNFLDEESFATFILFISIFSIISNTFGSELGIVRQIFDHKKETDKYNKLLIYVLLFVFLISNICIAFLHYSILTTLLLSFIIVLANIRLYASAYFRMNKDFKYVMIQNILYLVGLVIGLITYTFLKLIWIPLLFGEIFALIFSIIKTDLKYLFKTKKESKVDLNILKSFKDYSIIELLINMMTYFDKILIYPILGTNAVNVYYATTTMSKIVSLITNPLHGVILSWLNGNDKKEKNNIITITIKYCLPVVICISIVTIPLTYLAVRILYSKYIQDSLVIIVPISISVGFSFVSTIIKALLLKYIKSYELLKTYIIYLITFIVLSFLMSYYWNLFGFALANMISKIILLFIFFIILNKLKQGGITNEKK